MLAFLAEWLFVVAMLPALGAVGGFVVVPFRGTLPFVVLAAPFAGLLVMAFGAAFSYNVVGLPIAAGFLLTAVLGLLGTALAIERAARGSSLVGCWRSWLYPAAVALVLAGVVTWYTTYATIMLGHPGLQYWFGTDHLGYAHPADWMIAHPPWDPPRADPAYWYESWPNLMLTGDPRFGAFSTVALTAMLRGLPSAFAYDPACAVSLTVIMLGVAALFARGRVSLVLLLVGLLTSHWFDYTRSGFFGKTLGYPAGFFVAGLFMLAPAPLRPTTLISLLLMTCGASVVYAAEASGLFIGLLGLTYLLVRVLLGGLDSIRRPLGVVRALWQHVLVLGLMGILALTVRDHVAHKTSVTPNTVASITGTTAAMLNPELSPRIEVIPWEHVRLTLADLEHQGFPSTGLPTETVEAMLATSIVLWVILGVLAIWRRDPLAMALIWGPIALAAFYAPLTSPVAQWTRYQLPGTFYPLALCGAARLLDGAHGLSLAYLTRRAGTWRELSERLVTVAVVGIMLWAIWLHVPRVRGAIHLYASRAMAPEKTFSLVEADALAAAIGDRPVRVDIDHPHLSIFLLVELGRRGIELQWAPSSRKYVLGYRPWPAMEPAEPAELLLQSLRDEAPRRITTPLRTRQYRLRAPEVRR